MISQETIKSLQELVANQATKIEQLEKDNEELHIKDRLNLNEISRIEQQNQRFSALIEHLIHEVRTNGGVTPRTHLLKQIEEFEALKQ